MLRVTHTRTYLIFLLLTMVAVAAPRRDRK